MPLPSVGLLSVNQVAEQLGLHEQTVRKLIRKGDLVATPIGRRVLVHPVDLESFVERHRAIPIIDAAS